VYQMVNHGISTGGLFLLVGMLSDRRHTRLISEYGGLKAVTPRLVAAFLIITLSSIGLPGLNGFVGEFLVLIGSYPALPSFTVIAALGVVLAAIYLLWAYERVFTGVPDKEENSVLSDLSGREIALLVPITVLIIVIGLYPKLLLDKITPSTEAVLDRIVEQTDYTMPEPGRIGDVFVAGGE